jgi:hypothetical protein
MLSKQEIKQGLVIAALVLLGTGALTGFLDMATDKEDACEYKSLASRINLGYVAMCELWRPRFEKEKVCSLKTVKSLAVQNDHYKNGYRLAYFEDGTSQMVWTTDKTIGMKIQVCE